jgi:hypothetical protein
MKNFVYWSGVYNIFLGAGFIIPAVPQSLGIQTPGSIFWLWLPAVFVIYLGLLLMLCSRNLKTRAPIVYWEGILRVMAFLLCAWFGFFGELGLMLGLIGIADLLIGIVYFIGLPKAINSSTAYLFFDKMT